MGSPTQRGWAASFYHGVLSLDATQQPTALLQPLANAPRYTKEKPALTKQVASPRCPIPASSRLPWVCSLGVKLIPLERAGSDRIGQCPCCPLLKPLPVTPCTRVLPHQTLTGGTFVAEPGVGGPSSLGSDEPLGSMSFPAREQPGEARGMAGGLGGAGSPAEV